MSRLAIFIDGGYLNTIADKEFGKWINYVVFPNEILNTIKAKTSEPIELLRTYYYDCLPYQSNTPTTDEAARFSKARSFHDFLKKQPRFMVREGRLKFRGIDSITKEPIFQQKRVDLMIGLDFSLLSAKRSISHIALVAGDSDLIPALEVAQNEGILVWLFHGPNCSKRDSKPTYAHELWESADERCELDSTFLKRVEFIKQKK